MVTAVTQLPAVTTDPASTANPYEQASTYLGRAGDIYDRFATGGALDNINSYLNPYYEQVVSRTLGRMETDRDKTLNLIGDQAEAAGAFGGSRHGLMEGEFLSGYNQNVGDITADLMMRGYDSAAGMSRQDMMSGAQGMYSLAKDYYNLGNDITDRQMNAGNMQQMLLQQLLTGGAQQYESLISSPQDMLSLFAALAGADPRAASGSVESSSTPGLFDYLSLAAGVAGAGLKGGAFG